MRHRAALLGHACFFLNDTIEIVLGSFPLFCHYWKVLFCPIILLLFCKGNPTSVSGPPLGSSHWFVNIWKTRYRCDIANFKTFCQVAPLVCLRQKCDIAMCILFLISVHKHCIELTNQHIADPLLCSDMLLQHSTFYNFLVLTCTMCGKNFLYFDWQDI